MSFNNYIVFFWQAHKSKQINHVDHIVKNEKYISYKFFIYIFVNGSVHLLNI